jgi:hypothetical protein
MSFLHEIYDEAIYQGLLNKILKKNAQEAPTASPRGEQPLSPNDVAKKLVSKLSREFAGAVEPINISADTAGSIDLGVNQLQSLGRLLQFMATNKIKIDGIRVVYPEAESNTLNEEERNKLAPVSVNVSRDETSRKWTTADFYTHLPILIKYVSHLQDKAQELKRNGDVQGRVLEVMIGKLIDSVNAIKPDSGLSRAPKSRPDKPNEMPFDTVVDSFGTKVFDVNNPYTDKGPLVLTAKDLSSKESLNSWMRQAPEATIVSGQTHNKFTDPEANHCNIVNVLYKRAYNLARTAASPDDTKKYSFYLNKISQLGPAFTDPWGKACSIGSSVDSNVSNKHYFMSPQGGGGAPDRSVTGQIMEQMVQTLPLDPQDIDFNRIKNFFTLYVRITSHDNAQSAIGAMGTALQAMTTASSLTLTGSQQNFRITRNVQEAAAWLRPPAGNNGLQFIYALQQVIVEVGKVLGAFYNEFARTQYSQDRVTLNGEQKSLVEAQYLGPNSIYSQNLRDVQSLMANFQAALGKQ